MMVSLKRFMVGLSARLWIGKRVYVNKNRQYRMSSVKVGSRQIGCGLPGT